MVSLLSAEMIRAGFQIVDEADAGPRTLRVPIDTWLELGSLLLLGRNERSARLCDSDGVLLAWKGFEDPADCEEEIRTEAGCFPIVYPWDLLHMNEEIVEMLDEDLIEGEVSQMATILGNVRIGSGTKILSGTVIEGPVVIAGGCTIGPNAYIRGATSIGANCTIGQGAEIKNSIIYPNSSVACHCYVSDSVICSHVTLGAGTKTETHRHDGRKHLSSIQGTEVDTERENLGAFIGDGVKTGVNTSTAPGIKIGAGRVTKPGSFIESDLM